MRKFVLLVIVMIGAIGAHAADTKTNSATALPVEIKAEDAKNHTGTYAKIKAVVAEVKQSEKVTRLNLTRPFPSQPCTVVIFSAKTNLFPGIAKWQGKEIEVKGKIAEYKGHPEIIVNSTNQLVVVGEASENKN